MPYVTIDPTRYDAESPITESLMSDIIGNIAFNNTEAGIDGTIAQAAIPATSGSPLQIAIVSSAILQMSVSGAGISYFIDSSDDSFVANVTGTLTGSYTDLVGGGQLFCRKTGSNYEFYGSFTSMNYVWL